MESNGPQTGTRELYTRLRVEAWVSDDLQSSISLQSPAATSASRTPSHAAVLYDIAMAGALTHHSRFVVNATHEFTGKAALLFLVSATPMLMNWWAVSGFLAQLDSGDLFNEFVLVANMGLVVGMSLSVEPCAACVLADDQHHWCADHQMDVLADGVAVYGLQCRDDGVGKLPAVPTNCALYMLLAATSRALHVCNLVRAYREIQPRGRTDVLLHLCGNALLLPVWASGLLVPTSKAGLAVWCAV